MYYLIIILHYSIIDNELLVQKRNKIAREFLRRRHIYSLSLNTFIPHARVSLPR